MKSDAKRNLAKLVDKFRLELEAGKIKDYKEEATKTAFIQPLLKDVLGWDVTNRDEVSPEEKISHDRVDYGLKIEGKTRIFVEAKPPRADLNKHIQQAVGYGYNRKGVPFVLLTDFEELKLFDVWVKPDSRNPLKGLKIDLRWDQYLKEFDKIWLLSKESVIKGELDKLLLFKKKDRLPVDKAILDDLKQWREALAKDIYKNNPKLIRKGDLVKDAEYLKEITQKILDRIIFIRSCEDRKLVTDEKYSLKKTFEERTDSVGTQTMLILKEVFEHYEKNFDSDLFRHQDWQDDLKIDFKVMKNVVSHSSDPYQFDVIPIEVLGNIYEQYLGYTIRLTEQQVKYELKPDVRKAGGVYYTPEYIVDYIVKNTVGKLLKELPPNKIKKLRILDPACGSGSFLIRAYREMLNYYQNQMKQQWKKEERQKKLDLKQVETEPRLTIEKKSEILRNHIFGVDVDEQAVEVTKLSLMLKMLEGESGSGSKGRYILPMLKDNIKCGNSLISGSTEELKKLFGKNWVDESKSFDWKYWFRKYMVDEGGFDVVIGNPPYVKYENLEDYIKGYAKVHYECAKGFFDIFQLFLEKSFSVLKIKGTMGFIFPNLFLKGINYKFSREYFYKKSKIEIIKDYGDGVFENVKMPTCVMILRKATPIKNTVSFLAKGDQSEFVEHSIKQENFENENFVFGIANISDKLTKNSCKLGQIAEITRGLEIGRDKLMKGETKGIKIIFGQDISRYSIRNISYIGKKTFDSYSKNQAIFKDEKIVIRETGSTVTATYDNTGLVTSRSLYCIRSKEIKLQYLLGIVNSKIIQYFYETQFKSDTEIFPKIRIAQVKEIPVQIINLSNSQEKKLHDDLVALVDVMLDLNKRIQTARGREKDQIQRQIEKTDNEIDEIVYKLYGITEQERKIIESK
jgi:type I restriction-modification system DNA methylase subunit